MGNQRAVCERRQLQFPATIWISVVKYTHQIRLRILSCSRMSENHREPEVPEAGVPVVERLDGLARITLEELAITHSVKNSTLQNACSTRPRAVVGLGKSAHSHIVRLMNSRRKGLKRIMTKVLWLCWKSEIGKKENLSPMNVTIDQEYLGREVIRNWDKIYPNVSFLMHDNWVAYFRTWRRRSLFSRKGTDMPKPIQRVKFTKAIAHHTKIRDQNPSLGYICPRWTSWA